MLLKKQSERGKYSCFEGDLDNISEVGNMQKSDMFRSSGPSPARLIQSWVSFGDILRCAADILYPDRVVSVPTRSLKSAVWAPN